MRYGRAAAAPTVVTAAGEANEVGSLKNPSGCGFGDAKNREKSLTHGVDARRVKATINPPLPSCPIRPASSFPTKSGGSTEPLAGADPLNTEMLAIWAEIAIDEGITPPSIWENTTTSWGGGGLILH